MRPAKVGNPFTLAGFQGGDILGRGGLFVGIPAEALEGLFVLAQLNGGITVILGIVVIVDMVYVAVFEGGINHLRLHLVHRGQGIVFR